MVTTRRQFLKTTTTAAALATPFLMDCSRSKPPNIVLFFSDELSPDFLSCYGGNISTPNIDKLAFKGMLFTHAYTTAPMCTPSRYSLLSGRYAGRCKHPTFMRNFPTDVPYSIAWNTYLDPSVPTIARRLSTHGYFTGAVGKWHVGEFPKDLAVPQLDPDADPTDPQVDRELRRHQNVIAAQVKKDAGFDEAINISWDNFDAFPVKALRYHNFPWINQGCVKFLEKAAERREPFFLYAATTAVHGPAHHDMFNHDLSYTPGGFDSDVLNYMPSPEIKSELKKHPSWMSHKLAGMACLDHHVGLVMESLEKLDLMDNTIVIFLADHNVEPGKATVYEKGNRIPMIIRRPGHTVAGSRCDALVQSIDIFPSLLEAAGIRYDNDLDGKSMLPLWQNPDDKIHKTLYLESGFTRAITDGRYKYIAFRPPKRTVEEMKSGETQFAPNHLNIFKQAHSQIALESYPHYFDIDQLYDLETDPYELHNLVRNPKYNEILKELQQALSKKLETFKHPFDLECDDFLNSDKYRKLAANTRAIGTDYISWLPRDHGEIVWPPDSR